MYHGIFELTEFKLEGVLYRADLKWFIIHCENMDFDISGHLEYIQELTSDCYLTNKIGYMLFPEHKRSTYVYVECNSDYINPIRLHVHPSQIVINDGRGYIDYDLPPNQNLFQYFSDHSQHLFKSVSFIKIFPKNGKFIYLNKKDYELDNVVKDQIVETVHTDNVF